MLLVLACAEPIEDFGPEGRLLAEDPALVYEPGEELDPASLAKGAKVDLGHEVRSALPAVPGTPIVRRVAGPVRGELRLAFGAPETVTAAITFRVTAEGRGEAETLLERRLEPGELGRWHEARVDLSSGRDLVLRLETASDRPLDPALGLPFWAHPEVVRKATGERPPDVLLISIDTLRADHLSLYGYPRPTSPRLDAWARQRAAVFRNAIAPSPWTLPSHVSMLTGLGPLRHGRNHDVGGASRPGAPERALETLAEVLRRAGYATAAHTGGAYLHPRYGFAQGFDVYAYWSDRGSDDGELPAGVDRALAFLAAERARPAFFFLHTYAVHDPYEARRPFFERLAPRGVASRGGEIALVSPPNEPELGFAQQNRFVLRREGKKIPLDEDDRPLVAAYYDSGIARADAEIGRLLDGLEELGLAEGTIVIVTSDHGEALGEHGRVGHVDLSDAVLRVPLLMALPGGVGAGRTIEEQVRGVDVMPTILAAAGVEPPAGLDGVSLLELAAGRPSAVPTAAWSYSAAANRGLSLRLDNRLKYVRNNTAWPPLHGREELYDLGADPEETRDLAPEDSRLEVLRAELQHHFRTAAVGVRLRIANPSGGTLRGELRGPMVRPVATKSIDLEGPYVRLEEIGRARFEVPEGESFELHFEKVFGPRLELEGELETESGALPFAATLETGATPAALRLENGGWKSAESLGEATGFELWRHGEAVEHGPSPAEVDPELRRQLEALGYR